MNKKKIIIISIISILFIMIVISTILVFKTKKQYSDIVKTKEELEIKVQDYSKENSELKQEDSKNKIKEEIDSLLKSKSSIQKQIDDLKAEINNLNNDKKSVQTEIESLKGEVIKIKGEPKSYPAGYLTAGTDFDVGRYKIYDGSSNFVVYSSLGELRVNTILGGRNGVNEYIYKFSIGDKVEADSSFKMVLVN